MLELDADRKGLEDALRPLVGEEALPGVLRRLDELVADAKRVTGTPRR